MAVDAMIECFSKDLIPEYCHGLESSAVYTAPPYLVESLHGRSNRSLPHLPLHMHAEEIVPAFLTSHIYIGQCLPRALTLTQLWSYKMFDGLLIVRINNCVGFRGILHFPLLRDAFLHRLARGIPLKEGVLLPLQSKVRTPPHHLCYHSLPLQISHNAWRPPCPLHSDGW